MVHLEYMIYVNSVDKLIASSIGVYIGSLRNFSNALSMGLTCL